MLEFPEKGSNWLINKRDRELVVPYCMEYEEESRKRKIQELSANDEFVKRSEPIYNFTSSSLDHKRRRLREDSTNRNHDIKEGYYDHHRMSLDLELNLSPSLIDLNHDDLSNYKKNYEEDERKKKGSVLGLQTQKNMAWVAFDLDDDGCNSSEGQEDMVARVCMKCHMLVMLCKASPACPNCKFMHSPEDTSLSLLFTPKPTLLA